VSVATEVGVQVAVKEGVAVSVATDVGVQVAVAVGANAGVSVGGTGVRVGFHSHPVQQKDQVGLRHWTSSVRSG